MQYTKLSWDWLSNLIVFFFFSVFIGVSDREELRGNIRRNKLKKRIENDLINYNDWMKKGGTVVGAYN